MNTMRFSRIHPEKTAVCFTFDDNFSRHGGMIAPAFLRRGFRCTFYVNPGEEGFEEKHKEAYGALLRQGFEIGSHGYVHDNLSKLPPAHALKNLQNAAMRIRDCFGVYPATFAFPYHDYTGQTLAMAKALHLETRNTLPYSVWVAIRSGTPLSVYLSAVSQCISQNRPLVFSGHSAVTSREEADDERLKSETGYNPILLGDLETLLDEIKSQSGRLQALTFEQAALLAYIRRYGTIDGDAFFLPQERFDALSAFGICDERLKKLI